MSKEQEMQRQQERENAKRRQKICSGATRTVKYLFGWWKNPTDRFSFLLVLVTFLLFIATVGLYCATRDLVHDAKETSERQLRAYVGIITDTGLRVNPDNTAFFLDNYGLTPATDVKIFSNWEFLPTGQDLSANFAFEDRECADKIKSVPSVMLIFPKNRALTVRRHCIATDEVFNLQKAERGELSAFYYGNITYKDIFKERRRTNFCFIYYPGGSALCARHNEIDPNENPR